MDRVVLRTSGSSSTSAYGTEPTLEELEKLMMAARSNQRGVHTEHVLFECWVSDSNAPDVQLFRAPTTLDGSGTHTRLPHRVAWDDLRANDLVIALQLGDLPGSKQVVDVLQIWHVLEVSNREARVMVNNIVGSAADGEFVYDRLAGLVGVPPSTPD